jgi:hypothetical protein
MQWSIHKSAVYRRIAATYIDLIANQPTEPAMKSYLLLSALAASAALFGTGVQAQSTTMSNAEREIYGPAAPADVAAKPVGAHSRAAVTAELARARSAGEMDFAYAELNGALPQRGTVSADELRLAKAKAK